MAKQLVPVPVRVFTRTAIIDGVVMGEDGDFWDAWMAPSRTGAWGRRIFQATVYPMWPGAPPVTSPVVAVDRDAVHAAIVTEPNAALRGTEFFKSWKTYIPVTVFGQRLAISGLLYSDRPMLETDDPGEPKVSSLLVMRDVTIRSIDPTYAFEHSTPWAVLGDIALDTVVRTG